MRNHEKHKQNQNIEKPNKKCLFIQPSMIQNVQKYN